MNALPQEPIHINDLCQRCGFFNAVTEINNGYGCNHPKNESWNFAKVRPADDDEEPVTYEVDEHKVRYALLRKRFGSYQQIVEADKNGEAGPYINKAMYDGEALKSINVIRQGACYAHSCPLGYNMDSDDWKELGEDPEDWGDEWIMLNEDESKTTESV
ncbi:hypothetical protein [Arsenicibacter rosenii]|uniref:Uncharacterized protein n=1 Tax=Arsenicibacter rosenii TaxID=1750698 RepID=A0A1S2VD43_9BACT|nr:hypothetical protein [Arsenicibacter rosenii]OIN55848.1 hypothetical protein BLX24_27725 [Arsenicibacter rosenii]